MISFTLNGEPRDFAREPDKPLLWALREDLGLAGTKFGCGVGLCGACSVLLDGRNVRACLTPMSRAAGRSVTTIEGVAASDVGRRVVDAWLDLDVPQCGYCQAGQIIATTALLSQTPQPSDAEIDRAMDGQLCRCSSYLRIRAAIHRAAGGPDAGEAA